MTPDMSVWKGRVDEADGPLALRWHQVVRPLLPAAPPGVVLVGFACDEGVRRNQGRVGAAAGPRAIRVALANLAWDPTAAVVYDAGNVLCPDRDLEAAQGVLAGWVAAAAADGHRPLVLGGGHETAWGTFRGITAAHPDATVGVINLDAHLDLRSDAIPNSGTPFRQVADWCAANGRPFRYLCLGVSEASNTAALFDRADALGAGWFRDTDLAPWRLEELLAFVADFAAAVDRVHLSIDLDVLPAAVMPAVSAPAGRGVSLEAIEAVIAAVLKVGKLAAVDVVELNPTFDVDSRGARVAARLVWQIARDWREAAR